MLVPFYQNTRHHVQEDKNFVLYDTYLVLHTRKIVNILCNGLLQFDVSCR
jgi:hypothetical protein